MATKWISPTWRMPEESNQSKFENYSLEFDGSNELIQTTDNVGISGSQSRTMSVWLKGGATNNGKNWPMAIAFGAGSTNKAMWIGGGGGPSAYWYFGWWGIPGANSGDIDSGVRMDADDDWHMLTSTYDESTQIAKGYIDGVEVASFSRTAINTTDSVLKIGKHLVDSTYWDGPIGQLSIFDYTLSETQIKYLFNNNTGGTTPNPQNPMAISGNAPIAYYPLGGSSTGSASTLTVPNESVPSATVFNFVSADGDRILCSPTTIAGTGPINGINGAITISIWLNSTQASVNAYPINRDFSGSSDWRFRQRSDTNLFQLYLTNTSSAVLDVELTGSTDPEGNPYIVVNDGKWHHIVGIYNGTDTAELYTDGVLQGSATSAGFGTLNTGSRTVIGGANNSAGNPYAGSGAWDGDLSNAQIWNTNLSSAEVVTLYNNGVPLLSGTQPEAANLKGWWKMNVDTSIWNTVLNQWEIIDYAN